MTSLLVNIKDETKADDVVRFLSDISFLEIIPQNKSIESTPGKKTRYDFSDLAGKLKWHGDPVKVQRELRNEWQ